MSAVFELAQAAGAIDSAADVRAFEGGEVDSQEFDHAAHVRVAWSYLQQFPTALAIAKLTSALRSLTVRLGVPQKYHETVSWFFMIVIADRLAGTAGGDWETFRRENCDLFENGSALLKRHYSKARLESTEARQRFLLPDLAP
jgi:hypothetical protein